jgi:ArsR family transcriptional regulator
MIKDDVCEIVSINKDAVREVKAKLYDKDNIYRISEQFKLLGDQTRLKILSSLLIRDLCVCDISSVLGVSQSATSHQLRVLRNAQLVKYVKKGKIVYYSISDNHVKTIITSALKHSKH